MSNLFKSRAAKTEKKEISKKGCSAVILGVPMRDLVFKNLTSLDKRRKVLWASETITEDGVLTKIHKYLIFIVKEAKKEEVHSTPQPEIFVTKHRDTREKTERLQIKMKGSIYCLSKEKYFFITFCHTLKIDLSPAPHITHL